ncbi:hypothetical protein N9H90_10270 [Pseudomonadales bacterium]|nr:hypothetical protein [Pseudomonadales bacterium]
MKLLITVICILSASVQAGLLGAPADSSAKFEPGLIILDITNTIASERIAVLGDKAVVKKSVLAQRMSALENYSRTQNTYVIRRSSDNRLGTTDGAVLIYLHSGVSLSAVAIEFGLTIKHEFSALNGGLLMPSSVNSTDQIIARLLLDSRVRSAELNANYYLVEAQ